MTMTASSRKPLMRVVWGRLRFWHYKLFQQHRYNQFVLEWVNNTPILLIPEVFNGIFLQSGEFLARQLNATVISPSASVLDMGTGSGVGAVFAAGFAQRVIAVDINPAAVRCARVNALMHGLEEKIEARRGDLFAPVLGERFDVVLFNPPFFRGTPKNNLDYAWRSVDVVERFASQLREHLRPHGCALVLLSTEGETPSFLHAFEAAGFAQHVIAKKNLGNEVLTLYKFDDEKKSIAN